MDRLDYGVRGTGSVTAAQGLQRHDLYVTVIRDAGDSIGAPDRSDGTGGVSAVAVFLSNKYLAVAGIKVPAVNIIHVTVSVIVDSVTGDFTGVRHMALENS